MKKFLKGSALLVVLLMLVSIIAVGCSQKADTPKNTVETNSQAAADKSKEVKSDGFPNKPINVIVSYGAGGGTDTGARVLLPYVEKELGVPLNVINKPGGNGWVGWGELVNSKPDGYTIGYINTPALTAGYLNPKSNRKETIEDFALIANHVTDYCVIAVKKDEDRFQNIEELVEYAKKNELTGASSGAATDDHLVMLKFNDVTGAKIVPVHMNGGKETLAAIMGGHVDVYFGNVGEITNAHKGGDVKVLAVTAPERVEFLPDVPTLDEVGYKGIYNASARGLAAPKDIDPVVLKKITDAFVKAMANEEHIKKMKDFGLKVDVVAGQKYKDRILDEIKDIKKFTKQLGW